VNEQKLADLFSEHVDHMLQGEAPDVASSSSDLQALLALGDQMSQTQFQARAETWAAFQAQLATWSGTLNGGSMIGLSKIWFFSLIIALTTLVAGGVSFITEGITNPLALGPLSQAATATPAPTDTPAATDDPTATATPTESDSPDPTETPTPDEEPTDDPTDTPDDEPPVVVLPSLIFVNNLHVPDLCAGVYTTQSTLVNYGTVPISEAALVWEVIEGAEFVNTVTLSSNSFVQTVVTDEAITVDSTTNTAVNVSTTADTSNTTVSISSTTSISQSNYGNLNQIAIDQAVNLDVAVDVSQTWWEQPDGTEIKVQLSVANSVEIAQVGYFEASGDHNRGHGNDPDGFDEDNPGRGHRGPHHGHPSHSQIITIVKQGGQWVTLTGFAHYYGSQTILVDGHIIALTECTSLPLILSPGSSVQVTGILLPNGTFLAINVTIVDVNIIFVNFDSGVPTSGGSGGSGGSKGGGGSRGSGGGGGSHHGSGGSKKGS